MEGTDGFVFRRSFYESGRMLPDDERLKFYDTIMAYCFGYDPPEETYTVQALMISLRPVIDKSIKNYKSKCKNGSNGGAPSGNQNAAKDTDQPKTTENNRMTTENNRTEVRIRNKDKGIRSKDTDIDKDSIKTYSPDFDSWWSVYSPGRSDGKQAAYKAFKARLNDGYSADDLIEAARKYLSKCRRERTEKKYILMASTFLGPTLRFEDYMPKCQDSIATDQSGGVVNPFAKYLQEGGR